MGTDSSSPTFPSRNWLRIAFAGSFLVLVVHCLVLWVSGQSAVQTPVSQLSRYEWGMVHTAGLVGFGIAHFALAIALGKLDHGRLWPYGRGLLVASGLTLLYVAWYFAASKEAALLSADANDPLWIVASLTGVAMGALQPGLFRLSRGLGLFSMICLGIWLWLVPLILLVNESWLGAYERIVGFVYVSWMMGVSFGLIRAAKNSS